ncbi:hypothetical protein BKA80DRAFT_9069 [Phyllosticta citrichinensis]
MACRNSIHRSGRNPSGRASNRDLGSLTTTTSRHHGRALQDAQIFGKYSNFSFEAFYTSQTTVPFLFASLVLYSSTTPWKKKAHTSEGFPFSLLFFWDLPTTILEPIYVCLLQDQNAWGSVVERNSVAILPRRSNTARLSRIDNYFRPRYQSRQCKQDLRQFKTAAVGKAKPLVPPVALPTRSWT